MDPKELRGLMEAYAEVYAPQEEIEEGLKPLPKEKMSRQAARAYDKEVRAAAAGDEEETNRQMQRRIAMQMPSSRRTVLDKKKMGEEVEIDEAVKGESSERRKALAAERRAGHRPLPAKEGERYASHKLAQMDYVKRKRMGEEVEQIDEISTRLAGDVVNARIARTGAAADREMRARTPENVRATVAAADKEARARKLAAGVRKRRAANEEVEIFDVVLEFLQAEGYAKTLEEAEWLMANVIDDEAIEIVLGEGNPNTTPPRRQSKYGRKAPAGYMQTRKPTLQQMSSREKQAFKDRGIGEEYVDEAQESRNNPEKYEREQSKKYAPVRGERRPMPPRGNKDREAFERWYAANVR